MNLVKEKITNVKNTENGYDFQYKGELSYVAYLERKILEGNKDVPVVEMKIKIGDETHFLYSNMDNEEIEALEDVLISKLPKLTNPRAGGIKTKK